MRLICTICVLRRIVQVSHTDRGAQSDATPRPRPPRAQPGATHGGGGQSSARTRRSTQQCVSRVRRAELLSARRAASAPAGAPRRLLLPWLSPLVGLTPGFPVSRRWSVVLGVDVNNSSPSLWRRVCDRLPAHAHLVLGRVVGEDHVRVALRGAVGVRRLEQLLDAEQDLLHRDRRAPALVLRGGASVRCSVGRSVCVWSERARGRQQQTVARSAAARLPACTELPPSPQSWPWRTSFRMLRHTVPEG
jgi:hypothetical protein